MKGLLQSLPRDTLLSEEETQIQHGACIWVIRFFVLFGWLPRPVLVHGKRYWRVGDLDDWFNRRS